MMLEGSIPSRGSVRFLEGSFSTLSSSATMKSTKEPTSESSEDSFISESDEIMFRTSSSLSVVSVEFMPEYCNAAVSRELLGVT